MVLSMTGFAQKSFELNTGGKEITLTVEVRSLNNRFLDIGLKLPSSLAMFEADLALVIKKILLRGKISLFVRLATSGKGSGDLQINRDLIQRFLLAEKFLQVEHQVEGRLQVSDFLRHPDIFALEQEVLPAQDLDLMREKITEVLQELNIARAKEGSFLRQDILMRVQQCRTHIVSIEQEVTLILESLKNKIVMLEGELLAFEPDSADALAHKQLVGDVKHELDRADVHEEISRFGYHLQNCVNILESADQEKGKRLDFVTQELFREVNTLTSKSSNVVINKLSVDLKVEIEKIKEQVQNIL